MGSISAAASGVRFVQAEPNTVPNTAKFGAFEILACCAIACTDNSTITTLALRRVQELYLIVARILGQELCESLMLGSR